MPVDEEVITDLLGAENDKVVSDIIEEELPQFDPKYIKDFEGLNYLGALTSQFEWLGHKFVIRTLTTDEYLAVADLMSAYKDGIGAPRAYATAVAALCIETIDEQYLPTPVQEETRGYAWAYQRFNYIKSHWYPYTIDRVYEQFLLLESRAEKVLESMGNASGWTESPTDGLNANSV